MQFKLNSLDKYILGLENERIAFNSHFVFDTKNQVDPVRLNRAVDLLAEQMPVLRTKLVYGRIGVKRIVLDSPWYSSEERIEYSDSLSLQQENEYYHRPFDLASEPPFRILSTKTARGHYRLVVTVHHSVFDAHAHVLFLTELFRAYEGKEISAKAKELPLFRYRSYFLSRGIWWCLQRTWQFARPFGRSKRPVVGSLIDNPASIDRTVEVKVIKLSKGDLDHWQKQAKSAGLSKVEYLLKNLYLVMDHLLVKRGDLKRDIMFYLPRDLRSVFRLRYYFQNILGMIWINFSREEIRSKDFSSLLKNRLKSNSSLETCSRLSFYSGFFSTFLPFVLLRKYLRNADQHPNYIFSSLVVSSGRLPHFVEIPEELELLQVYGRGALLKSPGIAIMHTGVKGNETLTIEYCKDLFSDETIRSFEAEVKKALELNSLKKKKSEMNEQDLVML